MNRSVVPRVLFVCLLAMLFFCPVPAQEPTDAEIDKASRLFEEGSDLLEAGKPIPALSKLEEAIGILPNATGPLYNGGLAAFLSADFEKSVSYWSRVKELDNEDWQVRAKLVQAFQSSGKRVERDREREELFDLKKEGKIAALAEADSYCREQSMLGGRKVMVFEHFELKGDRALKYVFYVLDEDGKPEYRISLGSYNLTNAVWRETAKPKPKEDERLFHLDGYFDWGHATYGMYRGSPSYEETREYVEKAINGQNKPLSKSVLGKPIEDTREKQENKPEDN